MMVSGMLNRRLRRTGLSVIAMMLVSSSAFAQDVVIDDGDVMYAIDPIFVIDPAPGFEDESASVDETGADETGADSSTEEEYSEDDGTDDDWVWDEGDGIIVIDDGLCIGVDCVPGDGSYTYDGGYTVDGELVWYFLEGPRPEDCPECRDLPVEIYQMSAGGPSVIDIETTPTANSRRSRVASFTPSSAAECLALYPQLPWLCEWQNTSGQ